MIEISGTMKALSSLHIGTGKKSGTFADTLEYVPGRTIRGMLGYYLYTNHRDLFEEMKISEDNDMSNTNAFFKNALPMSSSEAAGYKRTVASSSSLKWCKKCGHLIAEGTKACSNFVDGKPCLQEGKKVSGFITLDSLETGKLEKASVGTHISTKCPITRDGHTSPGSDFEISPYHVKSIVPGTVFEFRCLVEDSFVNKVKSALHEAGIFSGLGGYRSRGYGSVAFSDLKEKPVNDIIHERAKELSDKSNLMMVTNSSMILKDENNSVIGFDSTFKDYISKFCSLRGYKDDFNVLFHGQEAGSGLPRQIITRGVARGWSLKNGNRVSEIVRCIGPGSCLMVRGNPELLAALEIYGIGEMTNSGYGDVYFMEGQV
ncbi:MAG: hypothetical protein PWR29_838 [Methanolobus sp.]|jgi:hypothetical protein|nr:hypothetical protein [Methanolobus sp.]MDK2911881.1 hypothetical protein [Methanolobus sp.]MDN5310562.1 hypothetical protein [Methanolobus sp.]